MQDMADELVNSTSAKNGAPQFSHRHGVMKESKRPSNNETDDQMMAIDDVKTD